MLGRSHSLLKPTIMAQADFSWTQVLPLVVRGIWTTNREEFVASFAELLYEESLRLPSHLVLDISSSLNTSRLLRLLKDAVQSWNRHHPLTRDLDSCTHVLIRAEVPRRPLQLPYKGPLLWIATETRHNMHVRYAMNPLGFLIWKRPKSSLKPEGLFCSSPVNSLGLKHADQIVRGCFNKILFPEGMLVTMITKKKVYFIPRNSL